MRRSQVGCGKVQAKMAQPEDASHSFIIRLWVEETAEEAGRVIWRGQITHVQGGERRAVRRVADICDFITSYLWSMGVRRPMTWQVREWLRERKSFWKRLN